MRVLQATLLAIAFASPASLVSQTSAPAQSGPERVNAVMTALAANAALGALTGLVRRAIERRPLLGGATGGALGGGIAYVGKHVTARDDLGLAGRQISAVGISVVRNAGRAQGWLDEIVFPLGPARLYVRTVNGVRVTPELDVAAALATAAAATRPGASLHLAATLAAGTPVFVIDELPDVDEQDLDRRADHVAGVITLWRYDREHAWRRAFVPDLRWFAHERVHVLQYDFAALAWFEPAESWLLSRTAFGRRVHPHFAFNVMGLAVVPLSGLWEYRERPWEKEAQLLSGTSLGGAHQP